MDSIEDTIFETALKFLYERTLAQLGIQADITVTKKEGPNKTQRSTAA